MLQKFITILKIVACISVFLNNLLSFFYIVLLFSIIIKFIANSLFKKILMSHLFRYYN